MYSIKLSLFLLLLLVGKQLVLAEEIYRHVDEFGNVSYSTQAQTSDAKPIDLPELKKEDFDIKIERLREQSSLSCAGHGGVDCLQKADLDGSVICADGYRDASIPYQFRCNRATLEVAQLNLIDQAGEIIKEVDSKKPLINFPPHLSLQLGLRNQSDVIAKQVTVELRNKLQKLTFSGPKQIEAYGIADYLLSLDNVRGTLDPAQILDYRVYCANCRSLRNRK